MRDDNVSAENWLQNIAIREAMDRLNEREQRILNLRFFQGRTQMEVAGEIGISQAQVSRLEKAALSHMRRQRLRKRVAVVANFNQQRAGGDMLIEAPALDLHLAADAGRKGVRRLRDGLRQFEIFRPIRPLVKARPRRARALAHQQHDARGASALRLHAVCAPV